MPCVARTDETDQLWDGFTGLKGNAIRKVYRYFARILMHTMEPHTNRITCNLVPPSDTSTKRIPTNIQYCKAPHALKCQCDVLHLSLRCHSDKN